MTVVDDRTEELARELASLKARLAAEFPAAAADQLDACVDRAYRELLPAKVTTFLPIFVARKAKNQLSRDPRIRDDHRTY